MTRPFWIGLAGVLRTFGVLALLFLDPRGARAELYGANTTSGTWSDASSWLDSSGVVGVPTSGDLVYIGVPGVPFASITGTGAQVTLTDVASVQSVTIGSDGSNDGAGTLRIASGGQLNATTLSLNAGTTGAARLELDGGSLTVQTLELFGLAASLSRPGGGQISADNVFVGSGAILETSPGDTVTTNATIGTDAALVLGESLTLAGSVSLDGGTLDLNGNNVVVSGSLMLTNSASITRGVTSGLIQASGFSVSGTSVLTVIAGDELTGAGAVTAGGGLVVDAPLANIGSLAVSGSNSSVTVNQSLSGESNASLTVDDNATLTVNASVTMESLTIESASLEFTDGVITTTQLILGGSSGSATVVRSGGGGTLSVGSVVATNGTALPSLSGDQFGSLSVSNAATVQLTQLAGGTTGLWLTTNSDEALNFTAGSSTLNLTFDTAIVGGGLDWVLKWNGDRVAVLDSMINAGEIIIDTQGMGTASLFYDAAESVTYIRMVPEPGAGWLVAGGLLCLSTRAMVRRRGIVRFRPGSPR